MSPQLFALGSNGSGQLGVGHDEDLSTPQRCRFVWSRSSRTTDSATANITKIVAGGNHTLVLLDDGNILAAGTGWHETKQDNSGNSKSEYGGSQTEHDRKPSSPEINEDGRDLMTDERFSFVQVPSLASVHDGSDIDLDQVVDVAATWEACFFVCGPKASRIYVCGSGSKGELGLGNGITSAPRRTCVLDVRTLQRQEMKAAEGERTNNIVSDGIGRPLRTEIGISSITACMNHVIVLLSNGDVYGWGSSRKGQLGANLVVHKAAWIPTRLEVGFEVVHAITGKDFTLLRGSEGQGTIFGETKYFEPSVDFSRLSQVAFVHAGWSNIHVLEKGRIQCFGRNNFGQFPADDLPRVHRLAVGSEHSIAVLENGVVVSWGWGEHGNCGKPTDQKGRVVGRWNTVLYPESDAGYIMPFSIGVGAGCATSFFWLGG